MRAAITFLIGLMTTSGGLVIRSCSGGADLDLARYWCGPQPLAMMSEAHAHCVGCGMAAGFVTMIAAIVACSLPRRRIKLERI